MLKLNFLFLQLLPSELHHYEVNTDRQQSMGNLQSIRGNVHPPCNNLE